MVPIRIIRQMAQPSENRTRTAALDLHGLARMQNVTAIRHDNRTDDGSGLEGRITNGNVSFVLNNENGKRLREDSVSSSGDGLDDSFHVPDSKGNYAHRTVKPGTIKACNECRQQKVKNTTEDLELQADNIVVEMRRC